MLGIFSTLRDLSFQSIALRMLLAVLCGGVIGIEREFKRRPAGFRTHILICLGATITTLTSEYLFFYMHYYTDLARLGAQVIAGIGFIGAGTIVVTRKQRVKGLTTAAGLWASAIVGLALGAGFYEGGILVAVLIFLVESPLAKWEYHMLRKSPEVNLYIEYQDKRCLDEALQLFQSLQVKVISMVVTRSAVSEHRNACAILLLRMNRNCKIEQLHQLLSRLDGIVVVEEL